MRPAQEDGETRISRRGLRRTRDGARQQGMAEGIGARALLWCVIDMPRRDQQERMTSTTD
jgi:hypothetical protein